MLQRIKSKNGFAWGALCGATVAAYAFFLAVLAVIEWGCK